MLSQEISGHYISVFVMLMIVLLGEALLRCVAKTHSVNKYASHNILEDDNIRQSVKDYSNWPTFPQVYFKGEFVGGCDIMMQMHQNGDLVEELKKVGIHSTLLDREK
ncbi:glutaredoxin-related protein 5, mitochondrial-like [Corticium candelabrum]|uniref:glutaredoxin-related protein 5, mitochondrial-like n=1 Tax=Corticium candelabrum TaxID=121492 RepID=UPI002E2635AE|nr:glutaredoxin-related protein 5, mitochondrial-like [Corticium candelabrum]